MQVLSQESKLFGIGKFQEAINGENQHGHLNKIFEKMSIEWKNNFNVQKLELQIIKIIQNEEQIRASLVC